MNQFLTLLACVLIAATALPSLREQAWWIRSLDFPRLQIAAALIIVLLLHVVFVPATLGNGVLRALLLASLGLQVRHVLPYTRLTNVEVQQARNKDRRNGIRLMFANVLQTNRNAKGLLKLIHAADPDVILALETDAWWYQQLRQLAQTHPHVVVQPQDNTYGMLLFSRLPLIAARVERLVEDDVPSIHAQVRLESGVDVTLHCLHPRPPAPTEASSSKPRDAELLIVGTAIKDEETGPVIVMGDMNDVAWSHTSQLFRDVSGLLDPRIGRGFFNTFSARNRLLRYPLDHFFHSNHFRLVSFQRLGDFGSDHFPVFIHLSYEPDAPHEQPDKAPDASEIKEANDKLKAQARSE